MLRSLRASTTVVNAALAHSVLNYPETKCWTGLDELYLEGHDRYKIQGFYLSQTLQGISWSGIRRLSISRDAQLEKNLEILAPQLSSLCYLKVEHECEDKKPGQVENFSSDDDDDENMFAASLGHMGVYKTFFWRGKCNDSFENTVKVTRSLGFGRARTSWFLPQLGVS
jgi:hypothetical protein